MQAKILRAATQASGLLPQIAVVAGEVATLAATTVPLADMRIMVDGASLHLAATDVASKVAGSEVTAEQLGGADVHAATTGVANIRVSTDEQAVDEVRKLMSYLPLNNRAAAPVADAAEGADASVLDSLVPDEDAQPYDLSLIHI